MSKCRHNKRLQHLINTGFVFQGGGIASLDDERWESDTEKRTVFLERNHSYFILVNDDNKDEFGADVKIRGFLEKQMKSTWSLFGTVPNVATGRPGKMNMFRIFLTFM